MTETEYALEVPIIISDRNGNPCIELRRKTINDDLIKLIVNCAFYDQPLIILPKFTNKIQSLNSLIEKGIMFRDQDGFFHFSK